MHNWIRRLLIKASIKSRTEKELMPSVRDSYAGLENFRKQIDYKKQVASEGIQPALTDEEAKIVRELVVNMLEGCYRKFEIAVEDATDLMDRTYQTFGSLEDD